VTTGLVALAGALRSRLVEAPHAWTVHALVAVCSLALAVTACDPKAPERDPARGAAIIEDPSGIIRPAQERESTVAVKITSAEVDQDDRTLRVMLAGGDPSCWSVERVVVLYEPDRIHLSILGGRDKLPPDMFCQSVLVTHHLVIRLEQAVTGRPIDSRI
jgi:hypothetical protein